MYYRHGFYEVRYDDKAESELEFCKRCIRIMQSTAKNMNTVKSVILDISGGGHQIFSKHTS